jgi:uncharacterized glyoxalase superfamily protein PhnB
MSTAQDDGMTNPNPPSCWPCLTYEDALGAIKFLVDAFGFEERLVVPGEAEGEVVHSQLVWPQGGGVMLGSTAREDSVLAGQPAGASAVYVVTDEPDALFERAVAAGAEVMRGLRDEEYGSRGFTVRDPEGNIWSFGTYRGE